MNEEIKIKYCSVCGEPTEKILDNPIKCLNLYTLPILCACGRKEREEYDRYVQERYERQHEELLERLRNNCFYNSKMHEWTFDVSNTCECIEKAITYVEHWDKARKEGIGLMFWGPVGTGKTFAAACIANALIDKEKSVIMTDFSSISNLSMYEQEGYLKTYEECDLLIIDDYGSERSSEFALQNVFSVINRRYITGKPLIITTNISLDELKRMADDNLDRKRIYDRIHSMCTPILVAGESRRELIAKGKMNMLSDIFNEPDEEDMKEVNADE